MHANNNAWSTLHKYFCVIVNLTRHSIWDRCMNSFMLELRPEMDKLGLMALVFCVSFSICWIVIHKPIQRKGAVFWAMGTMEGGRNSSNYCCCWLFSQPRFLLFSVRSLHRWSGNQCKTDSRISRIAPCVYRFVGVYLVECMSLCVAMG